jgi:trimeric autotransporter adhesin
MKIFRLFVAFTLVCFALLPKAQAVVPAPDGGYPGFTTAEGSSALQNLTTGVGNTATGWHSLFANTAGNLNTAIGAGTLLFNTGDNNTATGTLALLSNTGGFYNTADGAFGLFSNTSGSGNTGTGYQALYSNQSGANNAAYGYTALYHNTESFNTAFGSQTLVANTTGVNNTAIGYQALAFNFNGAENTACGRGALLNNQGFSNIAIGAFAGSNLTTLSFNIDIGNPGVAGEGGVIRIGNNDNTATYIAGIAGQTVGNGGSTCYVDNAGKLGVFLSARRYKENIQRMGDASSALYSLKPVSFRYKPEFDKSGTPHFGLIAEEVAEVAPDLVTHDVKGQLSTVRYDAVNAMLLNEFLKEHRKNEEQEATITALRANAAQQQKQIEALTATLQKVSAQLELNKPARQTVQNNR